MGTSKPLFTILKGGHLFAPADVGIGDVVVAAGVIANFADEVTPAPAYGDVEVIDVRGKYVVPGFLDQHVHLLGGGGEGGYASRTPEVVLSHLTRAGITTVVGCLGTDATTRHLSSLLAKARALETEGITAYIYTGAYEVPVPTITDNVRNDLILIDKVVGCGEVAISDHRSAQPSKEDIRKLAAQSRVGGILSGKAGVLHLHVGGGPQGLKVLFEILDEGEIPVSQFTPTHINRSENLLDQGIEFVRRGGMLDFTTSTNPDEKRVSGMKAAKAVRHCLEQGADIEHLTLSSDGNGSLPRFNERGEMIGLAVGEPHSLLREFRDLVYEEGLELSESLKVVTQNPARSLKLWPRKGALQVGADADILVLDEELNPEYVFARGRCLVRRGKPIVKGTFE
ncbi:isoaspartyl dipeptidase [Peptococcaceae bacterium CEB3]|nr:isoaspartyl dipeptidase [Peptococcaceae bacterium CEB3]